MIKKELYTFFSTPIGYLVIALFLLFNGLFLFVFKTDFNILNTGFSDLNAFFYLTPWVFIFLIPAITMRSFSDEIQTGTIEILKTKPISNWKIVIGKHIGSFLLILIALVPSLIYYFTIYKLGNPVGNIEFSTTFGSYIGLLFLATSFISIGLFSSTFSNNQIVSFLIAVCISFVLYYVFELVADNNITIQNMGMHQHFQNISKGIIDTRDVIYFVSISMFFLILTKIRVERL